MTVVDFTLKHVEKLDETLVDLLDSHKYPMTEPGAAILVSVGVRGLRNAGVTPQDILQLVLMLLAQKEE